MPLKRFVKSNPIKKAVFGLPPELAGGIYYYGRIRSGKSVSMLSLSQRYHYMGYKIFDIDGGERNENLYWCFPSRETLYWKKLKKYLNLNEEGPKQYRVNLLVPMFMTKLPKKLPEHMPNVKSTLFQIPVNSLSAEEISLVTGIMTDTSKGYWNNFADTFKKTDNTAEVYLKAKQTISEKSPLWKLCMKPLLENQLICGASSKFKLDIEEEMKDREVITVLCTAFLPKEYKIFVMNWLLKEINELLDAGRIKRKNIIMMREAGTYFRAIDSAIVPENMKIFRTKLSNYIRMGRRGVHIFCDTQSPSETRGIVSGQQDLMLLGVLTSQADREEATYVMYRDNLMSREQISQLSMLNPGEMFFCEVGKKVKKRYVLLPRSMFWKENYRNFFSNVWKRLDNNWYDIKEIKKELFREFKDNYNAALIEMKEKKEEKLEQMRQKQEEEEDKEEERKLEKLEKFALRKAEKQKSIKDKRDEILGKKKVISNTVEDTLDNVKDTQSNVSLKPIKKETFIKPKSLTSIKEEKQQKQLDEDDPLAGLFDDL